MAIRLVEVSCRDDDAAGLEPILARHCSKTWHVEVPGPSAQFACLVHPQAVEPLLADLNESFGEAPGFRAIVIAVEAAVPPISAAAEQAVAHLPPPTPLERFFVRDRLSTDEILEDIEPYLHVRFAYLVMAMLSSAIAALGMQNANTAVVIGAMIIAPLLSPSIGMALAATVGDRKMGLRAITTVAAGSLAAILAGIAVGRLVHVDPSVHELALRSTVAPSDLVLSLASGAAGVLALSRGRATSLVGVMIAVALVPPLAALGLFLAHGLWGMASGAAQLFATNLIGINVAGIATFLLLGLPPKNWRLTAGILALWTFILLLFLTSLIGWLERWPVLSGLPH